MEETDQRMFWKKTSRAAAVVTCLQIKRYCCFVRTIFKFWITKFLQRLEQRDAEAANQCAQGRDLHQLSDFLFRGFNLQRSQLATAPRCKKTVCQSKRFFWIKTDQLAIEAWVAAWLLYRADCLPEKVPWSKSMLLPQVHDSLTKVPITKKSPIALRLLRCKNVFLRLPGEQFEVLHAFRGSYSHPATKAASHMF